MNSSSRIGKKIRKLRHEGVPQRQAVGEAMGIARANRITESGGYRKVKRSRRKVHKRVYNRGKRR